MDMNMNHMQMEHEAGTSYLWLIVGAVVLLLSIAAYIWSSRTQKSVLAHMKKNERAVIKRKPDPFAWGHMHYWGCRSLRLFFSSCRAHLPSMMLRI